MKGLKRLTMLLLIIAIGLICVACGGTVEYTVQFMAEGKEVSSIQVEEGKTIQKPADPAFSANKRFEGWFIDETFTDEWNFESDTVQEDMVLYAGYTEYYSVSFSVNGQIVSTENFDKGEKVKQPADPAFSANKRFEGWFIDETFTDEWNFESDTVQEDMVLYAGYTEYYSVSFSVNGQIVSTENFDKGEKVKQPADPALEPGTKFTGWYSDESFTAKWDFASQTVTADTTLYAGIEEVPYDIVIATDSRLIKNTDENVNADYQLLGYTDSLMVGASGGLSYDYQFSASITEVENAEFTYQSSDPSVVTVNEEGLAEFLKTGKATIWVTCPDGLAKIAVSVFSETGYKNFFEGADNNWRVIDESHYRSDLPDSVNGENSENYRSYIGNKANANFQFDPFYTYEPNEAKWVDIEFKQATNIAMLRFIIESTGHITSTVNVYGYNDDVKQKVLLASDTAVAATTVNLITDNQSKDMGSYQMDISDILKRSEKYTHIRVEFIGATAWFQPTIQWLEIYTV